VGLKILSPKKNYQVAYLHCITGVPVQRRVLNKTLVYLGLLSIFDRPNVVSSRKYYNERYSEQLEEPMAILHQKIN
jgi:hypothetical protein